MCMKSNLCPKTNNLLTPFSINVQQMLLIKLKLVQNYIWYAEIFFAFNFVGISIFILIHTAFVLVTILLFVYAQITYWHFVFLKGL